MNNGHLVTIRDLLELCSADERALLFKELRATHQIHEFERVIGAPAEMILEAVHRAPELTRRMLRGVIADAAFRTFVVPTLQPHGWEDITPPGNFAYDYMLAQGGNLLTVQVKLQRSEKGSPVVRAGGRFGFPSEVFIVETQKTRTGTDGDENQTRPYRYGEFDILAVSMQPSTGQWHQYKYTLGRWLIAGRSENEMATLQPVAQTENEFWTDNFEKAAGWFRAKDDGRRMAVATRVKGLRRSG